MDVGDGAISAARGQDLRPRLRLRVCVQKLDGQEPKAVLGCQSPAAETKMASVVID